MKKYLIPFAALLFLSIGLSGCASNPANDEEISSPEVTETTKKSKEKLKKSAAEDSSEKADETKADETEETVKEPEILITDWKYRGFGYEVPESAEELMKYIKSTLGVENVDLLKNGFIVDASGDYFIKGLTVWACGEDADQAINALNSSFQSNIDRYEETNKDGNKIVNMTLREDYWVELDPEQIAQKPYIAIRLYDIEFEQNEALEQVNYYKYNEF